MKLHELDDPEKTYANERLAATTLNDLKAVLERWKSLALDGWRVAAAMTEADFEEYQCGVKLERQNIYGGDEWYEKYRSICFPEILFQVSMMSVETEAPWNVCFEEYIRQGFIDMDEEGIARFTTKARG
jgi:hypothetical protein